MPVWNWAAEGFVHPPGDTLVNMEQRWNDTDSGTKRLKSSPSAA
jgi:hypothetical protein